jgi:hypothetical protein
MSIVFRCQKSHLLRVRIWELGNGSVYLDRCVWPVTCVRCVGSHVYLVDHPLKKQERTSSTSSNIPPGRPASVLWPDHVATRDGSSPLAAACFQASVSLSFNKTKSMNQMTLLLSVFFARNIVKLICKLSLKM